MRRDRVVGEGNRQGNPRMESITDIAYLDDKVLVAGLSNEEFFLTLQTPFPFAEVKNGAQVEIYHGSHGRYEKRGAEWDVCAVQCWERTTVDRGLYLHAAGADAAEGFEAGREGEGKNGGGVGQYESAAGHDRLPEGWEGLFVARQQRHAG